MNNSVVMHSASFYRFVYTKLLSVLGKERRPIEALQLFKKMQVIFLFDFNIFMLFSTLSFLAV